MADMHADRFTTRSLRDPRVERILSAALRAVDPRAAVGRYLRDHPLEIEGRLFGLAIGKAAVPMLEALAGLHRLEDGLAVTKHAPSRTESLFAVMEGGHPVPDARSLAAGERALRFVSRLEEGDLLVCLISGGGSALVSAPYPPISLDDMQSLTSALLASGARIDEINTLRRHLDRVKGGGLLRAAAKGRVNSLILSDVIGNPLEAIASGPTAPDPTTREDALAILVKYRLGPLIPPGIISVLKSAPETLKPGDPVLKRVRHGIVADNLIAASAARRQAVQEGFEAEVLTTELQGEAREVGRELARRLRAARADRRRPFCLIAGGETTVTLTSHPHSTENTRPEKNDDQGNLEGKGGRNQELALAAAIELAGAPDVMLIALATDGEDGPTDAAGAVVTGESAAGAESLGLDAAGHLSRNDAYPFFEALGDLLKPGYTGTNVNDLTFLFGF